MLKDRYDNQLSIDSMTTQGLYGDAMDRLLAGAAGMVEAFEAVIAEDSDFAMGQCGLARARQTMADMAGAKAAIGQAQALADGTSTRERSHINAMNLLIGGQSAAAYKAIREHLADYPRDAMIAQTCSSVFGLIGFSGQPGREAELLAFNAGLRPHYGDDWWQSSQYAFSLCETGQLDQAGEVIDKSLSQYPRNAHGAHIRAHVYYESGEARAGVEYLTNWLRDYDKSALMHGHLSWHAALWLLNLGDTAGAWRVIDTDVGPGASRGVPLNILTDTASFLYRAELAGETVTHDRWVAISGYAKQFFPKAGLSFVDFHSAMAHAMAGDGDALRALIDHPVGPAAGLVRDFAEAYGAIAKQSWSEALIHLGKIMSDHVRLGGSRAQRDLIECTFVNVLLKLGQNEEAGRFLALRRPVLN